MARVRLSGRPASATANAFLGLVMRISLISVGLVGTEKS
jgi:hypothetical protein